MHTKHLRAAVRGIKAVTATAAVGMAVLVTISTVQTESVQYVPQPHAVEAAALVAEYDCWTGPGPANVIPGHAVVTLPGEAPALVPSKVGFGIWLDGDPGTLHAFCR